jgi:hypothetical protein
VFDLNAIESNDQSGGAAKEVAERLLLTAATGEPRPDVIYPSATCGPDAPPDAECVCSPEASAPHGLVCEIRDLTFSPDALIVPSKTSWRWSSAKECSISRSHRP